MRGVLRGIAWDEVSGLPPEDLFQLARRYKEFRFRPRSGYEPMLSMDQLKEDEIRENVYEMLRMHLQTQLTLAQQGDLEIRIRVQRDSISIVGVGTRPSGRDPKNERAPGPEQRGVACAR